MGPRQRLVIAIGQSPSGRPYIRERSIIEQQKYIMSHPYRLIVFDFDGTLVDSQDHIVAAMIEAFTVHGLAAPTREDVRRVVGLALEFAVARLLPDPEDMAMAGRVAESYRRWQAEQQLVEREAYFRTLIEQGV